MCDNKTAAYTLQTPPWNHFLQYIFVVICALNWPKRNISCLSFFSFCLHHRMTPCSYPASSAKLLAVFLSLQRDCSLLEKHPLCVHSYLMLGDNRLGGRTWEHLGLVCVFMWRQSKSKITWGRKFLLEEFECSIMGSKQRSPSP